MTQTVVGIFNSASDAQNAVDQLLSNGFDNSDVDMKAGNSPDYATSAASTSNADTSNGISRFFKNLFNDDDATARYSAAAARGTVVSVYTQTEEEAQRASMLLDQYGAIDVDDNSDNSTASNTQNFNADSTDTKGNNAGKKISVMEEKLQVGKREVSTGGVRIKSRIVEKPVEQSLRLREEQVSVNRNKVDRVASDADFANFNEGTIEMKEYAEVPVVSKEARVVEEISLDKQVNERNETVRDTVRKTEVDVEQLNANKN